MAKKATNTDIARQSLSAWMTVREVAADTRLSERGVRQMIAAGRLPAHRIGARSLRIRRDDVDGLFTPLPTAEADQT